MTTATQPQPRPEEEPKAETAELGSSRHPYSPPRLRHLGSVRELTLGATGSAGDGGATMMARM